jgi:hypothetical protein
VPPETTAMKQPHRQPPVAARLREFRRQADRTKANPPQQLVSCVPPKPNVEASVQAHKRPAHVWLPQLATGALQAKKKGRLTEGQAARCSANTIPQIHPAWL